MPLQLMLMGLIAMKQTERKNRRLDATDQNTNIGTRTDQPMARRTPIAAVVAAGGLTAVGVAWAAAYTSRSNIDRRVGIAAWVAAAVVGTAATIAAARNA